MTTPLRQMVAAECRRQRGRLVLAGGSAAAVAASAVLLLGMSGWFITAASLAGAGGIGAATAFNTLLPSAGIRLLAILRTGCRYTERLSGHDAAFRALARIRPALYAALAARPPAAAMALSAGEAVARIVQDVNEIEQHFVRRSAIWGTVAALGSGLAVLLLAGWGAAAAVALVAAAALIVAWRLAMAFTLRGRAVPQANGRLREDFAALVAASAELRAYGLEDWAVSRIDERAQILVAAQQRVTAASGWFEMLLASSVGLAAMLALALARWAPLPVAALAALAGAMAIDGIGPFIRGLQRRGQLQEAELRLGTMLDPVASPGLSLQLKGPPDIEFRDRAMTLLPGTFVGITGPSGIGKTTLLDNLLQLRTVERGHIRLGGVEINDLPPAVIRRCFAIAPQDLGLLAGTVRENLLLADPDASDAALWTALHDAVLDDKVRTLRHGLDTWLGEDGAILSGGERRRLVLARAYLRDAPWLLLDEPTEGLDRRTEALVVERLGSRLTRSGQGAILVSHRPAPLASCHFTLDLSGDQAPAAPKLVK